MVRRTVFVLSILAAALLPADWVRRADVQGNVTDVAYPEDRSEFYVATDGAGVWAWNNTQWEERNNGLPDLRIRAITVRPDAPGYLKAATTSGLVYKSTDGGQNWSWDSAGLNAVPDSFVPTDLVMVYDYNFYTSPPTGEWLTYMATLGGGVFRQVGLSGAWAQYANGMDNTDILCIGAISEGLLGRHQVVCGARFTNDGQHPSRLYILYIYSNLWLAVSNFSPAVVPETSFTSIALHELELALVGTSADTGTGQGVYASSGGQSFGSWTRVCSNPPSQTFWAVDYLNNLGQYTITGGTPSGLWKIDDPSSCPSGGGYTRFNQFRGKIRALGIMDAAKGIAGGPGKGPVLYLPNCPACPATNRRQGLSDNNILDIGLSTYFGAVGGDSTIFTASGIGGVYKNRDFLDCTDTGYFYRMLGDPDSWGTVSVLKVKLVPGYNENYCRPFRRVFAATAGQGVLESDDGGRSWIYANGSQNELGGGIVTDLAYHLNYNGTTNRILYAAVYGRGVYQTADDGGSWSLLCSLPNLRVLSLGVGSAGEIYIGCRTDTTTGGRHGLYKYFSGDCSAAGGMAMDFKSVSVLAASPYISGWLFAGTEDSGVWGTADGANSFWPINNNLPGGARIHDLKMCPWFNPSGDTSLLVAVQPTGVLDGGVYYTNSGMGWNWNRIVSGLPIDSAILSVAFSPRFGWPSAGEGQVFCGHATRGLYSARISSNELSCGWDQAAGFFNVPPNVKGVAVAPDDPSVIFTATEYDGVFISRDAGDSFQPWGANLVYDGGTALCPVGSTLSVAVTHSFAPPAKVFLDESFTTGIPATWTIFNGGTAQTWKASVTNTADPCYRWISASWDPNFAIIDSDCEYTSGAQDDVLFSPAMNTSSATALTLKFDHYFRWYPSGVAEHGYVYVYSSGTGYTWVLLADYTGKDFGPESVSFDLTPYRGTDFYIAFQYTGAYDWYWAIDHVWVGEAVNRVVVGTRDHGIYYADYNEKTYFGDFQMSNVGWGTVNEVRYKDLTEDMRASHVPDGDYHSADYGVTWTQVPGVTTGLGLMDVNYSFSGYWDRALNGFVWGCSSGKSLARGLGDGAAWYYNPLYDCDPGTGGTQACWQECPQAGLDPDGDYRSVLQLTSNTILMGSIGKDSSSAWQGLYRSDDSCATWRPSSAGLPDNPKVYAFQADAVNGYVLASVVDSDLADGDDGGVFYSEDSSGGRAWAKTSLPSSTPSSYDMATASDGSALYTGLSSDGLFSTLPSSIPIAKPAAYFEAAAEACVGSAVQFYNYSAGNVTVNAWTFGDGGVSAQANPSHAYASAGTYYPTLTVTSGTKTDNYPDTPYGVAIDVMNELDVGNSLRMAKTGTPGEVLLSWTDVAGESQYRVHFSNDASAPQFNADLPADSVSFPTSAGYSYFRIQPLGADHVCGDGITGGTW